VFYARSRFLDIALTATGVRLNSGGADRPCATRAPHDRTRLLRGGAHSTRSSPLRWEALPSWLSGHRTCYASPPAPPPR